MHDTETSSADQARLFTEALKSYGIEPVVTVPFTTGTKDFSSHIAQVQASGADAIIGAAFQTEAAILIQQIRSLGIEAPILGSNGFADPVTIQLAGELNDNVYCASAWVPNTPNPKGAALAESIRSFTAMTAERRQPDIRPYIRNLRSHHVGRFHGQRSGQGSYEYHWRLSGSHYEI